MNENNNINPQEQTNVQTISYNTNYNANVGKKSIGLGLASMLIGIIGIFVCCCFSIFQSIWVMCFLLAIFVSGLVLGIVAVVKDSKNGLTNGMGIAGIIICSILVLAVLFMILAILAGSVYTNVDMSGFEEIFGEDFADEFAFDA